MDNGLCINRFGI